jgi:hypothetical protein
MPDNPDFSEDDFSFLPKIITGEFLRMVDDPGVKILEKDSLHPDPKPEMRSFGEPIKGEFLPIPDDPGLEVAILEPNGLSDEEIIETIKDVSEFLHSRDEKYKKGGEEPPLPFVEP